LALAGTRAATSLPSRKALATEDTEATEREKAVAGWQVGKLQVADNLEPSHLQTCNSEALSVSSVASVAKNPLPLRPRVTPEMERYSYTRYALYFVGVAWQLVALLAIFRSGLSARLRDAAMRRMR